MIITISGPSTTRQRNAIKMAFRWRADDGPTLNAGLVACDLRVSGPVLLRNPIFFCNFPWGGGGGGAEPPVPTSGSAHDRIMFYHFLKKNTCKMAARYEGEQALYKLAKQSSKTVRGCCVVYFILFLF